MSKRINTVTTSQESIEAALARENEQSVIASQAPHADSPDSGDAALAGDSINIIVTALTDDPDIFTYTSPPDVHGGFEVHALGGNDQVWVLGSGFFFLYGELGNDYLYTDGAGAYLNGGAGDDSLYSVNINASIYGGLGDDYLYADGAGAYLDGGDDNDTLWAAGGAATLIGGNGNDSLYAVHNGFGITWLDGGAGDDVLNVVGVGSADMKGGDGNDTLIGGDGHDWLDGGAGADSLSGGAGYDTATYWDATAAVSIDLTKASSTWTGDAQGDVFTSIETLSLTSFADTFRGDANANTVFGGSGDDQLFGGGGNDFLTGGDDNDIIQGGEGNDYVQGDTSESLSGDDYLQGNAGDDLLFGDGGNDRIVGGTGNDTVVGGLGGDSLAGNQGADIFRYTAVEQSQNVLINGVSQLDQISDFTQGQDKIDLSGIDANPTLEGDQAFTFIADPAHYTGNWTGVVWQTAAANGIVTINVSIDGDADADMQIYMSHPYQLTPNISSFDVSSHNSQRRCPCAPVPLDRGTRRCGASV